MIKRDLAGDRPAVFVLRDQTELEVYFVELFDDEYEYKENQKEYLYALKVYSQRQKKFELQSD